MWFRIILFGICLTLGIKGGLFAQKDSSRQPQKVKGQAASSPKVLLDSALVGKTVADSLVEKDSIQSNQNASLLGYQSSPPPNSYERVINNPFIPPNTNPTSGWIVFHEKNGKENVFYLIAGILLLLATIRIIFPKYLNNLFVYFFQRSRRQNQTKDRLLQEQLSSLLLNLLFFLIVSTFITLAARNFNWFQVSFIKIWLGSLIFIITIYAGKYLFLQFAGWVFNSAEVVRSYIFIVFMMNKMLGILLVPLLLIVAFSVPELIKHAFTLGWIVISTVFVYRYLVSFATIRNKIALNGFHFFICLTSVEIIPLLLIYKLLMKNLAGFN